MRSRAYRPEPPVSLEDRSLLSGAAGPSADPVVLPNIQLTRTITQTRLAFQLFSRGLQPNTRGPVTSNLRSSILDVAVNIPFGLVDGLGVSINRIINTMQQELDAKVRFAVPRASDAVIAAIRADVAARVQAGDVIVK